MVSVEQLRPFSGRMLRDATIPELPNHYSGKVRDNYDLPDGRRVIIATDRLSAFDRILCAVPFKGQVLTQTARFWFEATRRPLPQPRAGLPRPERRGRPAPRHPAGREWWCAATSPAPPAPRC